MRRRSQAGVALVAAIVALVAPAAASAHASLSKTSPSASATLTQPPAQVSLTYSEPIEPRERPGGIGLRTIDEDEKTDEAQGLFVGVGRSEQIGRGSSCDCDHAGTRLVESREGCGRLGRNIVATLQHTFGLALHYELPSAVGRVDG